MPKEGQDIRLRSTNGLQKIALRRKLFGTLEQGQVKPLRL